MLGRTAVLSLFVALALHGAVLGPTAYTSFANSPFSGLSSAGGYFHLETFEDGSLNTPGVTPSTGVVLGPGGNIDSVDPGGRSFFASSGPAGIRFTFDSGLLGSLPTHAGIVWTDGVNSIRFEAFDQNGVSLGILTGSHADNTFLGTTGEDRFYGAINAGGISSILIQSGFPTGGGGIEVDHLQYGVLFEPTSGVPEPGTFGLFVVASVAGLAGCKFRSRV